MVHHTLSEKFDHTMFQWMSEPIQKAAAFLTEESMVATEVDLVLEATVKSRLLVYLFVPMDMRDILIDTAPLDSPIRFGHSKHWKSSGGRRLGGPNS